MQKLFEGRRFRAAITASLILAWGLLAVFGVPSVGKLSEVTGSDLSAFLPKSSESSEANEQLKNFVPGSDKHIPLTIVFENTNHKIQPSDLQAITTVHTDLQQNPDIQKSKSTPIVSDSGKAVLMNLSVSRDADMPTLVENVRSVIDSRHIESEVKLTGPVMFNSSLQSAFEGIDGKLLLVAVSVVFVILLAIYRSPLLPVVTLGSALVALAAVSLVIYQLAKAGTITMNQEVQGILFILVIGAATDYSLLYIARYREELASEKSTWKATIKAWKASYIPIIAAGSTVAVGLLCFLLSDLGSNKALGQVGGIGVAVSVLTTLTLFPVVLALFGRAAFWPRKPLTNDGKSSLPLYKRNHPIWTKIGNFVGRHPRALWSLSTVILLVATVGIFQLKAEGVSQTELVLGKSEAREAQDIISRHFVAGTGSESIVVSNYDKRDEVLQTLNADSDIDSIYAVATGVEQKVIPMGKTADELNNNLRGLPSPFTGAKIHTVDGQMVYYLTLKYPGDSHEARQAVRDIRTNVHKVDNTAHVGGIAALMLDTNDTSNHDIRVIMPAILAAITIILMVLLRSVVAPLILLLSTMLSFGATLGVSALIFNHLWHFAGSELVIILYSFVFLVALGIDYNIFLMTRVREEVEKHGVRKGTLKGLIVTGGVITSAGIVLAATFASLSVLPIMFLVQIAFIVTFGVLLDTIVVRTLIVPALALHIGKAMWWPSKLYKKL